MRVWIILLLFTTAALAAPSPFLKAIRSGDLKSVQKMLTQKPALVSVRDPAYGSTPLMTAVSTHQLEIAKLLLARGANVNDSNDFHQSALHLAVQFGFLDMTRWLLENGADPNLRSKFGVTPLGLAVANRRESIAEVLRQHGGKT